MNTEGLNSGEKASLSQLARRLVERGKQGAAGGAEARETPKGGTDQFSAEGQLLRILELEKRIETISKDWSKSLNAVLSAVERLEARVSRLDGEMEGLHDREEGVERMVQQHREELTAAAIAFADTTATRLESVLDQVDALVSRHAPDPSVQTSESTAGSSQRG